MSANNKFSLSLLLCIALVAALSATTLAQVSTEPRDPTSYGMTSGRLVATVSAVLALIGVVSGGLALARRVGKLGAIVAVIGGLIGTAAGGYIVATSAGVGTGGGKLGAFVALVLGLISLALAAAALVRGRPAG